MKNLAQQFDTLGRKQLAIQEGIDLLRQTQQELLRAKTAADAWGMTAVLANVVLVPLNCIVNAFELKGANSVYQMLVRAVYAKFAASGTRVEGQSKAVLALLKKAIVDELKRKALTDYVPGVNILVGLAEDSLAAWQTANMVEGGRRETNALAISLERKIDAATRELMRIGVQRAQILERMETIMRTA